MPTPCSHLAILKGICVINQLPKKTQKLLLVNMQMLKWYLKLTVEFFAFCPSCITHFRLLPSKITKLLNNKITNCWYENMYYFLLFFRGLLNPHTVSTLPFRLSGLLNEVSWLGPAAVSMLLLLVIIMAAETGSTVLLFDVKLFLCRATTQWYQTHIAIHSQRNK